MTLPIQHIAEQEKAVRLSLLIDLATILPVVSVAILSGSMILYADIADYAKSLAASLIAWRILRNIRRGETLDYDYGPGKLESLGGLIGLLVLIAGLMTIAAFSIQRLIAPVELHTGFMALGIALQVVGFLINAWLWRRNKKLAAMGTAPLMEMQWRTNRAEALSNLATASALLTMLLFQESSWAIYIDPAFALIFVIYAISSFMPNLRERIGDLIDKTLDESLQLIILRRLAEFFDRYESFIGVRSRRAAGRIFIEIRLSFSPEKTVGEATDTIVQLRRAIEQDIPHSEVSVVLEPYKPPRLTSAEKTEVQILPLSPATLPLALELINKTFNLRPDEMPDKELEESLWPGRHTLDLANIGISDPRYWVALHDNKVIGVTGLTYRPDDRHEAVWGGWTVFDQSRKGASRARYLLLKKTMIEAAASGRKYARLYTTTAPSERQANHFYDKMGLAVYKTEERGDGQPTILYRQMDVEKIMARFKSPEE